MPSAMSLILLARALAEGSAGEIDDTPGKAAVIHDDLQQLQAEPLLSMTTGPEPLKVLLARADALLGRMERVKALIDQYHRPH